MGTRNAPQRMRGPAHAELDRLLDSAALRFFACDKEQFVYANNAFAEMLGYRRDELIACAPGAVLSDDSFSLLRLLDRAELENGRHFFSTVVWARRDGSMLHTVVHASCAKLDGRTVITGTAETQDSAIAGEEEIRRLNDAIERAAMEWRLTVDAIDMPIVVLDGDGKINRINRAARMIAGKSFPEILGRPVEELGDGEPWRVMADTHPNVIAADAPVPAQVSDDSGRTWDILAMPFHLEDMGAEKRVIIIAWDVTPIVRLQASIGHLESMSLMGALVAGVAHEVRNPLFAISATLDALEQTSGGAHREYFAVLHEEVDRMTRLMQDLLAYGSPAEPAFAHKTLRPAITQAVRACSAVSAAKGVAVHCGDVPDQTLFVDEERLARAFQNVIENAIQHSPAGEEVTIVFRAEDHDGEAWVECRVSDRGPGLSDDDLPHIFEPFFSRRRGGTGLGLSIVQKTIEEHGGNIRAWNRDGGGAEVVIRLPVEHPRVARVKERGRAAT